MAKRTNTRTREREASREAAMRRAAERADRRRRIIAVGAVFVVLLALAGTIFAAANDRGDTQPKTTSTTTSTLAGDVPPTTPVPGPTVPVTPAAAGATLAGPTPCPAEDGSSPRTTMFAGPPPTCIDPAVTYDAVISTSVGDLKIYLNSELAPTAVNNFIVLARYHYYDGVPFTTIISRTTAQLGSDVAGTDGRTTPGYSLPGEYPKGGTIVPTGTILMMKVPGQGDHYGGAFQLAMGEKAADLPADSTVFGLTLDGTDTLLAIDKAGTQDGGVTKEITVNSVRIEVAPVTSTTTG